MFSETFKIFILLVTIFIFSGLLHLIIELWQLSPLKEEKSVPVYITKEIKED